VAACWKGGHFVTLLGEGDVFGELAPFGAEFRQATVKSKTKLVVRMVKGNALQELLRVHKDEELMQKWESEMDSRMEQLAQKESLHKQSRYKPVQLDFMFMKLQTVNADGQCVPKNEPMDMSLCEKPRNSQQEVRKLDLDIALSDPHFTGMRTLQT